MFLCGFVKHELFIPYGEFKANSYSVNITYRQVSNISRTLEGYKNCRSLRCSWSIACRRCPNYIFILDLTPGFMGLGKDNCKTRRETIKFGDLVRLMLDILRYSLYEKLYRDCIQHVFRTCFFKYAKHFFRHNLIKLHKLRRMPLVGLEV